MGKAPDRQGVIMSPDLRKQLKLRAVEMGISVSQLISNLVQAFLSNEKKVSK